jgi:hypothetical protein
MRRLILLTSVIVLSCAASLEAQQVLCESIGGTYRQCRVASSGTIRLVMEMSDRACFEGTTWGTAMTGIVWVNRGCRATFAVAGPAVERPRKNRIICESQKGEREVCAADTNDGVTLTRQLSQTKCIEGENWGFDDERELVWVDHGCRAEFILGSNTAPKAATSPLDTSVVCESDNNKRKTCKADTSAGVQIVKHLSNSACGFDREWGYDAYGIWVTKGCRAEFVVRGKPKTMMRAVTCESIDNARNHCPGETQFGVALVRQIGERDCVLGTSWGFDESGVWVAEGCHAQFALGGYRLPANAVPESAQRISCESLDGGRKQCPVDTTRGVGLIQQLSDADCVLNRSWGYDRNGIWVTNGCRAEFAVAR